MNNIHVGDIGTVLKIQVIDDETETAIDISAATTKQFILKKPNKSTLTVTADFTTTGSDGFLQYSTVNGDLDQAGAWKIQAKVIGPTYTNTSEQGYFYVNKNV